MPNDVVIYDDNPKPKVLFSTYSNYTYVANGATKGAQVPQNFRYIDPRKISVSVTCGF